MIRKKNNTYDEIYSIGNAVVLLPPEACETCNRIPPVGGEATEEHSLEPPGLLLHERSTGSG